MVPNYIVLKSFAWQSKPWRTEYLRTHQSHSVLGLVLPGVWLKVSLLCLPLTWILLLGDPWPCHWEAFHDTLTPSLVYLTIFFASPTVVDYFYFSEFSATVRQGVPWTWVTSLYTVCFAYLTYNKSSRSYWINNIFVKSKVKLYSSLFFQV